MAGEVTTAGSVVLRDSPPAGADAVAIARLKSAGLIPIGRNNMTEFAYSGVGLNPHYGTPAAPFERSEAPNSRRILVRGRRYRSPTAWWRSPSGPTRRDRAGSPRRFAASSGSSRAPDESPRSGAYPLSTTLDSIGPLARHGRLGGARRCAHGRRLDGRRCGASAGNPAARHPAQPGVRRHRASRLRRPSTKPSRDWTRPALSSPMSCFRRSPNCPQSTPGAALPRSRHSRTTRRKSKAQDERYDPRVKRRILSGAAISGEEYLAILRKRSELIGAFQEPHAGVRWPHPADVAAAAAAHVGIRQG